jgi:hypothetical protein
MKCSRRGKGGSHGRRDYNFEAKKVKVTEKMKFEES